MFDFRDWRLRRISRRLTWLELQAPDPEDDGDTAGDVLEELLRKSPSRTLLGYYTRTGLEEALRQYGAWDRLEALGLRPHLALHHPDPQRHLIRVTDGPHGPTCVELVCRFAALRARAEADPLPPGPVLDLIAIEWLMLQNPRRTFTRDRPPLPGQRFPGLGMGREVMTLLHIMCERLQREGLLGFPEHYHNAILYSPHYRYIAPACEGRLRALRRDLAALTLAEASWAVELGLVTDLGTGVPLRWSGEEMVRPACDRLATFLTSPAYVQAAERACAERRFTVDREAARAAAADAMNRARSEPSFGSGAAGGGIAAAEEPSGPTPG